MTHEHSDHSHHEHTGHHEHEGHGDHAAMFRKLFWVHVVLAIPVVLFNSMFAGLIGYELPDNPVIRWISPVLGTVMFVWGGRPFFTGALDELRAKKPGMMMLIALGITVAFGASWAATLGFVSHELDVWWELALLIVIMLLGHWLEMRSVAQTTSALDSLAALLPDTAERIEGEQTVTVSPDDLRVGDVVLVRPGASVPADGAIVDGEAGFDESMITGESRTVRRAVGERVVAGTVATDSGVRVEITAVGDSTALAGIGRMVADAQATSSRAQRIADKAAGWLFWFALASAAITLVAWLIFGQPDTAIVRTISVLVIACPHALGLAIPLVVSISTERAARAGLLVKDRLALEAMRTVDTVLFDKTGTLTKGEPEVTEIIAVDRDEAQVLALAAAAEADSEHPLGRAIVAAAHGRDVRIPRATDFSSSPAVGVRASVDGSTVEVGGPRLLEQRDLDPLPDTKGWDDATVLHVVVDGKAIGALRVPDAIRAESQQAIDALHERGVEVVMITGDAEKVANSVGRELGIDRVLAEVRPEHKADEVAKLQAEGRKVAMVGDGVNDAPALAKADVGLAIGAGTDVAIGSAGVVLASSDPRGVLSVIDLSKASYRKMLQNLWWAGGYNLLAVPLAAGVLAPVGFMLPMSAAAVLMSLSTIVVAANAQLLRRLDLDPASATIKE